MESARSPRLLPLALLVLLVACMVPAIGQAAPPPGNAAALADAPPMEPPPVVGAGRNAGFFVMSAQKAIERAVETGALTPPAAAGTTQYVDVPTICVIYTDYYHDNECQVHLTPEDVAVVIAEIEKAREFIWRASGLKYHMKNDYLIIGDDPGERTLTPEMMWSWEENAYWLPFWSCDGVTSVEQDLRDHGIVDNQYSVVLVTYAFQNCDTAWTPIGGGTYGVDIGCMGKAAYIGDPMAWGLEVEGVTEHEYLHAIDSIFEASGNPLGNDMFSADQAGDFPYAVDCGQHFNFVLCQILDPASWLLLDPLYATLRTAPDADNDGVPDVGGVPITEATLGSSTSDADSDDDGLSDLRELIAAFHAAADPLNPDTDGDGVVDGADDYPLWNVDPVTEAGSPVIDGVISPGEYTETARYNAGNPDLGVIVYTSWSQGVLSIAASVDDDMISTYYDEPGWNDNFEIRIDVQKDGWEFNHGNRDYRLWIVPKSASGSRPVMAGENHSGQWPVNTSIITARYALRPGGYVVEASIPQAAFPGARFADGESIRLTFNVEDYDEYPGWPCYNLMTHADDDRPGFILLTLRHAMRGTLWRNATTGQVGFWLANCRSGLDGGVAATVDPASGWEIEGVGDFDGDGLDDVLWRNVPTGQVAAWLIRGLRMSRAGVIGTVDPALGWAIRGVGDFDGDGRDDLLWHNTATGQVAAWLMRGLGLRSAGVIGTVNPASGWAIAGVGDFHGDGKADVLWRNATTGDVAIWQLNGLAFRGGSIVGKVDPASGWTIEDTGDFNADGKSDILWHNVTTGQVAVWLMNGARLTRGAVVATVDAASDWAVVGTGDFDSDGRDDIVWERPSTGQLAVWRMRGAAFLGGAVVRTVDPASGWSVQAIGNFR